MIRDIILDHAFNESLFHDNLESVQYNALLAITGAIRGTSREELYQEIGLKSLEQRHWFRKLCTFHKIYNNQSPSYLFKLPPLQTNSRITRSPNNMPCFQFKQKFFKNYFISSAVVQWNNLDLSTQFKKFEQGFQKIILQFT